MPPELAPANFCQRPHEYTPTRKPLGLWFEEVVTDSIDWSDLDPKDPAYKRHNKAEDSAYRALFEHHELPFEKLYMSQFSLVDLCRIVSPPDQHEIWLEVIEIFFTEQA